MTKRYGRNQKRAARAKIAELAAALIRSEVVIHNMQLAETDAMARAFDRLAAKQGYVDDLVKMINEKLSEKFVGELEPHARSVLRAAQKRGTYRMPHFDARTVPNKVDTLVISGTVPRFVWNMEFVVS